MAGSNLLEATDANFDTDVLAKDTVSLVDFWAEWCGPCRMLAPTIDALADEYAGKVKIFKMNVDENPRTPTRYSIRGIPTLILFKNGRPVEQIVGNQPKENIVSAIEKQI